MAIGGLLLRAVLGLEMVEIVEMAEVNFLSRSSWLEIRLYLSSRFLRDSRHQWGHSPRGYKGQSGLRYFSGPFLWGRGRLVILLRRDLGHLPTLYTINLG